MRIVTKRPPKNRRSFWVTGKLVSVGGQLEFFHRSSFHRINQWIIDQLTTGRGRVEIWAASYRPFRDEVRKLCLLDSY